MLYTLVQNLVLTPTCKIIFSQFHPEIVCVLQQKLATRIMSTFGTIKEFCPGTDSITNIVAAEKQFPILLTSKGAATYDRLCDLLAPTDPSSKTLDEIAESPSMHTMLPYGNSVHIATSATDLKTSCGTRLFAVSETKHYNDEFCRKLSLHTGK
jgi:hypothetical protein